MFIEYKIEVNKQNTEAIQRHAFTLGYYWEHVVIKDGTQRTPQYLGYHYLALNDDGTIFYSNDEYVFKKIWDYNFIEVEDFLKLTKEDVLING